jgi:hypothetical protein
VPPTQLATPRPSGPSQPGYPSYNQPANSYDAPNAPQQYNNNTNYGSQFNNAAPPPPPSGYSDPYAPGQNSNPGYNNPYSASQQPGGYYPQMPKAPQPRKVNRTVWIVGGVLLLLILIVGGLLAYAGSSKSSTTVKSTPTATHSSITATAVPNTGSIFSDNFSDNHNKWSIQPGPGYGAAIGNSLLSMKEANHRIFQEPVPATQVPNDFAVSTTFTFVQGDLNDSAGLQVRTSNQGNQGYVAEIYGDGAYDIIKITPDPKDGNKLKFTNLASLAHTSSIHAQGQPNTMTLMMKGPLLVLQFNGQTVKTVTDSNFTSGSINLFLSNGDTSKGAMATFSNIAISPAPAQLPHA